MLANPRFVRYALAKFLQLAAQNALIYGLFILVVSKQETSLATSAFVLTSVLPSIVLSLPGGVLGDALPNKLTLTWTLIIRSAIVWAFLEYDPGLAAIIGLTSLTWAVYQFYTPGENAAVLAVVPGWQLAKATALLHAVSLLAQLGGAGLLAPLALRVFDERGLFGIVLFLLMAALLLFLSVPHLSPSRPVRRQRTGWLLALPAGIRTIRSKELLLSATILRVLLDTAFVMVVVAAPQFVKDILNIAPENTIYIVAPGALGVAAGLITAPPFARLTSPGLTLWLGFLLAVVTLLLLAWIQDVSRLLDEKTLLPLREFQEIIGIRREIAATMIVLPLGGFGMSLVQVASRATVYELVPPETLAQVFATQSAIGSLAALGPTLLAGVLVDFLPVSVFLAAIGGLLLILAPTLSIYAAPAAETERPAATPG